MAIKFLDHLDLNNISQLQDTLLHNTTEATTTNVESKIIYDTTTNTVKYHNGVSWVSLTANTDDNDIDYISNVVFSAGNLTFTGVGNAFSSTVTIDGRYVESVTANGGITIGGTDVDPTVGITYSGANSVILDATDGTGITVASTDKFLIVDDSDASDTVKYINFSQLSTALGSYDWDLRGDSGGTFTIASGDIVDIAGGTKLTTISSDSGAITTLQINHDNTTRTDTALPGGGITPAHGGTFDVIDSVTSDPTGHITAVNVKTVTLPSDNNTVTNAFTTHTVTDADSGYTWAETGSAVAESTSDTLTWVSGTGIDVDVDATSDAIRIAHADTSALTGAQGSTGISSITVDGNGHVTAVTGTTYNNYVHPNHTGHVTSTSDGATVLTVSAITGQTPLTAGLLSTDELVLSDGGVIKRMDVSVIEAYMQANLTFTSDNDTKYDLSVLAGAVNTSIIRLATSTGPVVNDDITISGTDDEITVTESGNIISIGLPDNVIIAGNLTVNGTTTTVNTEEVLIADNILVLNSNEAGTPSQAAGVEVERGTEANVQLRWDEADDDWEFQAYDHAGTPVLQTYKIPTSYQTTIGNGVATSIPVSHNLGTKNVIVQLWDTSSFDTVFASVVRNSTNQVTISFSLAPTTGDITVLVIAAQGQQ